MEWIFSTGLFLTAVVYWSSRYAWWRPAVDWRRPRVLMYHMVSEHRKGARFNKLRVPPGEFVRQMAWLKKEGFSFLFASELFEREGRAGKSVCLTFDDGYRDNLLAADRVLEETGGKATLYLVEDRSGGWSSKKKAHHADDELAGEAKLSDDEVRTLLASGRWELGGHTRTHANLAMLVPEEAREEIASARRAFREKFVCDLLTFAYPFGIYNTEHESMVREAGYLGAMTTEPGVMSPGRDDPFQIPRIKISGKEGLFGFIMRIRGGKRGWKK